MRVAITGGSGFVGSKLVSAHLARGDKVNILTRTGTKSSSEDCKVFSGDITQPNLIPPEFFMDVDVVYHCAGELRDPFKIESVNVDGTRNLLNSAAGKIRRWVQVSSVGVYGIPNIQNVDESAPLQPLNSYEATKMEAERLAVNFASRFGFDYVILRPSTIYGYGMPSTSLYQLANFVRRGLFFFPGPRMASANYVYIDNVVSALLLCGLHPAATNKVYNVSDYSTVEELVFEIADLYGVKRPSIRMPAYLVDAIANMANILPFIPLTPFRVAALSMTHHYSIGRIKLDLAYRSQVPLREGLRRTLLGNR